MYFHILCLLQEVIERTLCVSAKLYETSTVKVCTWYTVIRYIGYIFVTPHSFYCMEISKSY